MPQPTSKIASSPPPDMAERRDPTRSEWELLLQYGEAKSREKGIVPDDVPRLVEEYRAEISASRT